jgi:hypothetical protein
MRRARHSPLMPLASNCAASASRTFGLAVMAASALRATDSLYPAFARRFCTRLTFQFSVDESAGEQKAYEVLFLTRIDSDTDSD